jgi:hypothetical protein
MSSAIAPSGNPGIDSRIMFERYTEKARRVIFFARYEASQYGSPVIDTEYILLGLLREDRPLMRQLHLDFAPEIRDEIAKVVRQGERISTSVEMPLSADAQKILQLASEEADANQRVGTEHILLGILRVEKSLAAKLLMARGAKLNVIREQIAKVFVLATQDLASALGGTQPAKGALAALDNFLGLLRAGPSQQAAAFFHDKGQFVDSSGKRWLGQEIEQAAEILFAPFAKRNANFFLKSTTKGPSETFVASLLWEFAAASSDRSKSLCRMSIVLASTGEDWTIVLMQVTPLKLN